MMNKVQRLQSAAQVAHTREDQATEALADSQRCLAEHQSRLQQLLDFRTEYAERLQVAGQQGIVGRQLRGYTAFLASLDAAISQAHQSLERLQEELQRRRQVWVTNRAKTQALEEVIHRYRLEQGRAEQRREQAESDERSLRGYRLAMDD